MIRTAILGASGYVGGELLRLLSGHPEFAAAKLYGESKVGQPLTTVHPHLAPAYAEAGFERFDGNLVGIDLVFAALPHGESQKIAPAILARGVAFVDRGADFRLDDAEAYRRWYGHAHVAPHLLGKFAYGIPELNRDAIRGAKAVAAAGCYATAAILALTPLVRAGLIEPDGIIIDAASGVSGAGREAKEVTSFSTVDGSLSA
jgi:N-acetyl-gamma-glutamyl-phosphate reductase